MKKIYIVLTHTGTMLSRIIKMIKGTQYNHVSIALEPTLRKMYSFGRLYPYNPFIGGFVEESINYGTFKRFKNTYCEVYSIEVLDEQYYKIKKTINDKKIRNYKFNIHGLINASFNKYIKYNNKFFCSEFVKYVLESADIDLGKINAIKVPYPQAFEYIPNKKYLYTGLLKNYIYKKVYPI